MGPVLRASVVRSGLAEGWSRTPWVGWCVDSCRPGTRCLGELVPLS